MASLHSLGPAMTLARPNLCYSLRMKRAKTIASAFARSESEVQHQPDWDPKSPEVTRDQRAAYDDMRRTGDGSHRRTHARAGLEPAVEQRGTREYFAQLDCR